MGQNVMITVSRFRRQPIRVFVKDGVVGAEMDLQSFLIELVREYGSPIFTLTKKGNLDKLEECAEKVINEMKQQTKRLP